MSEIAKIKGYDIRDKKLADATSASSVASTDAIRMKTTTGDEVYIDRDSFVGAIASVFKANNSSTVTSLFGELTADNESSPCSINMSNLASVLSADVLSFQPTGITDVLNQDWVGILWCNGTANIPRDQDAGFCISFKNGNGPKLFLSYDCKSVYFDEYVNGHWTGWAKVALDLDKAKYGGYS